MKTKNAVKRIGIASLCLATAISAFSGISSFNTGNASAESTTVSATDLVTASAGATVTSSVADDTTKGLLISSDVGYEATFNEVFYKNSFFQFRFPETYDSTKGWYGDFKLRVSDVTDESNYFDLIWYISRTASSNLWTGLILQYKDQIRTCSTATTGSTYYNFKPMGIEENNTAKSFLPHIQSRGARTTRWNKLTFNWNSSDVLTVKSMSASHGTANENAMVTLAKFDGTYDETASKNGFVAKTSWGLPKISFPNGYKVTVSSYMDTTLDADKSATDVLFANFSNNCTMQEADEVKSGTTHNFTTTTEFSNNYIAAYNTLSAKPEGKVLLGWKDAQGALYSTGTVLTGSADVATYSPVYLGYDTMNGASVRVESAEGTKSGIRFMTLFDQTDYAAVSDYITSFGTLIGWSDTLTKGDFNVVNYDSVINAETGKTIAQVENTKGVFTYKDKSTGTRYTAYSMALVDIADYTREYSARGYLVVTYADETTQIIYTDFNAENNTRSVAQVAYNLKTQDPDAYDAMTEARKAIVDTYAAAYVVPDITE